MPSLTGSFFAAPLALSALPAIAASEYDIHYAAEHVPESGMDAHYQTLPWPGAPLEHRWAQSIDVSTAHTTTDFIDLDGPMVAFAATRGLAPGRGYELLAFYSTMDISGGSDRLTLTPWRLHGVPLDRPQPADFSNPRGTYRHYGVGAAFVRERGRAAQLVAGLLLESVDAVGYEVDYTLAAGADAGASGVIDYSHDATFVTPFVGWQRTNRLSRHWSWTPRAQFLYPLPPGDMDVHLIGPGFDVRTPRDGDPIDIGDPYVSAGLALAHAPSGFEVDLGGMLFFPLAERVSHPGVDRAFVVHVAWRWGAAAPQD